MGIILMKIMKAIKRKFKSLKFSDPMIKSTHSCGAKIQYNEEFDSYFCGKCNIWLNAACSDPNCMYCKQRPARPEKKKSDISHETNA